MGQLQSLHCILYANMSLLLNWTAQRGGEMLKVGNEDAGLFSCGLYFEERKDA